MTINIAIPYDDIAAFCQRQYERKGQKPIEED